jgi:uncharacterized protein with FMN-binding domain
MCPCSCFPSPIQHLLRGLDCKIYAYRSAQALIFEVGLSRIPRMAGKKISTSLTALSSAAILAVYSVGYHRTSAAADRFAAQGERKPPVAPVTTNFVAPAEALPSFKSTLAIPPADKEPSRAVRIASGPKVETASPLAGPAPEPAVPAPAEVVTQPSVPATTPVAVDVPSPVTPPAAVAQQGEYKDGTYTGWGSCRHGDIQASVTIEGGRIISAAIATCYTRYPCTWIDHAPGQVVSRQSINVDYVSGATQSVNAFKDAIAEALSKAK